MLNKLAKLAIFASVLSLGFAGHAAAKPKFSIVKLENAFEGAESPSLPGGDSLPTVHVDWQDGNWIGIHDEVISFNVAYHVKMKSGYVHSLRIGTAERGSEVKDSLDLVNFWDDRVSGRLRQEESGIALTSWGFDTAVHLTSKQRDGIVAACNAGANENNHYTTSYDVPLAMRARGAPLKDEVNDGPGDGYYGKSVTKNVIGLIRFKVICDPPEQDAKGPPRAGNDLYSVDLKVDQHGESCPKDVTVTAYADYRWPAESHMRMQVDGGFPKARVAKTKEVTFAGKTFNRAEAEFHYKLDPGQKTFKLIVDKGKKSHTETVEIKCPPFKVLSAWLKYEVENKSVCPKQVTETATYHTTRPGWVNHEIKMQGGLVVSSGKLTAKREGDQYIATAVRHLTLNAIDKEFMANALDYPANSGWMALKVDCLDVKGDFTFLDKGAPKCPREGRALVNFKTNMPGNIHYSLDCTNGHFSGVAQAVPDNKGGYVAPALVKFNVEKTTQATCALKSVAPIQKVHTFKGHQFQCVIPSGHSATNDVAREPSPATHSTHRPRKKADAASDHAKKARQDAEAERRRHEALKKQRAEEAHKKTEAAYKRREAARQAVELRHKREAAKKAAALRRQREAAKKALQVRHLQTRHRGITAAASQSGVVLR